MTMKRKLGGKKLWYLLPVGIVFIVLTLIDAETFIWYGTHNVDVSGFQITNLIILGILFLAAGIVSIAGFAVSK